MEFYPNLCSQLLCSMENLVIGIAKLNPKSTIHHINFMDYCEEGNKMSEWLVLHSDTVRWQIIFFPLYFSHHLLLPLKFPCRWKGRELTSQNHIQTKENTSLFIFQIFCRKLVLFRSPTPFLTSIASWMTNNIQNRMYKS